MNLGDHSAKISAFVTLATFTVVAGILYFAKVVIIPIALAALLSFLLAPLVVRLMRWKFPRAIAIITAVTFSFAIIGGIIWLLTSQTVQLIERLPQYQDNLQTKIAAFKKPQVPGVITRASRMVKELKREIETEDKSSGPPPDLPAATPEGPQPVPVEVQAPKPTAFHASAA